MTDPKITTLAEVLRLTIGSFVRRTRAAAGTASDARAETLGLLGREGAASTASLARARHVRHQSMRLVLSELEAEGLITSLPDPADGRGKLHSLTPAGEDRLHEGRSARAQWIAQRLAADLTTTERAELAAALRLLNRLEG